MYVVNRNEIIVMARCVTHDHIKPIKFVSGVAWNFTPPPIDPRDYRGDALENR